MVKRICRKLFEAADYTIMRTERAIDKNKLD